VIGPIRDTTIVAASRRGEVTVPSLSTVNPSVSTELAALSLVGLGQRRVVGLCTRRRCQVALACPRRLAGRSATLGPADRIIDGEQPAGRADDDLGQPAEDDVAPVVVQAVMVGSAGSDLEPYP